jgi:hypothetical protein
MGTNYYAEWHPGGSGSGDGPASVMAPAYGIRLHICKSHTSFQGKVFNSWSAWRNFLESNEWNVTIRDEYGGEWEVAQFIDDVESTDATARGRQHKWMVDRYPAGQRLDDWADADGFSFHRGEFS